MIASISEEQCGAETLWHRGRSNGMRECSHFGTHIGQNYFKSFASAVSYFFVIKVVVC